MARAGFRNAGGALRRASKGEVYLQAGAVLPVADELDAPWPKESTHRFALAKNPAAVRPFAGGSFRLATSAEWPVSREMCGGHRGKGRPTG